MYQEFFIQKGVLILPIVAMLSFVLSFLAILLSSLRTAQKPIHEELDHLPLDGSLLATAGKDNQEVES